jgi:hypothetical protein
MMSPSVYQEARQYAAIHAQLRILERARSTAPGAIRITGLVVRVFRNVSGVTRLGRVVHFSVRTTSDRCTAPSLCGEILHDPAIFYGARWLEAFLDPTPDGVTVVRSQVAPIRGPTLSPVIRSGTQEFCTPWNSLALQTGKCQVQPKSSKDQKQ